MDILATLESNVTNVLETMTERNARAEYLRAECDRLVSDSLDLSEPKAKQARNARAEYLAELELTQAQNSELARRYAIALQAVKEYKLTQAQESYNQADQDAREKRQALQALFDERLHFINHGGRKGETSKNVNARRDLEVKIANAQAALTIANRATVETGRALQLARA